jgi:GH25 family lysozyme M1 (1,4-beta-N-acetylmuramidase)
MKSALDNRESPGRVGAATYLTQREMEELDALDEELGEFEWEGEDIRSYNQLSLATLNQAGDRFSILPTGASGPFQNWVWPIPVWNGRKPVISQEFKPAPDPKFGKVHGGVDIMYRRLANEPVGLPESSRGYLVPSNRIPVLAAGNGVVVQSGKNPLGHHVIIDHGNGFHTFYQHLIANGLPAKSTRVTAGTPIGFVGHNPAGYKLNHLHFEVWPGGVHARSIDPAPILHGVATRTNAPRATTGASAQAPEIETIRHAIQQGVRDENILTDMVFHARHPELGGRRLRREEQRLIREWLDIRDRSVRPTLQSSSVARVSRVPVPNQSTVGQGLVLGLDTASIAGNRSPNWIQANTEAGIRFAIIRSNWGTWEDSVFRRDWPRIKEAGMVRGAYMYLRFPHPKHNMQAPDPVAQARKLIQVVGPLDRSDLPPTLDIEFPGGRAVTRLTAQQCLERTRAAWKVLKDYYGVAPIIYTSARVWRVDLNNLAAPDLVESPLWLARYPFPKGPAIYDSRVSRLDPPPVPPPWGDATNWWIHQYQGDALRLPGFPTGNVDLNRFNLLFRGTSGDRVKWVQRRLGIIATGQFDEPMVTALRAFQSRNGPAVNSIVDIQTFANLCWSNP